MNKTEHERLAEEIAERAHSLPDQLKKALFKRSMDDASNLLRTLQENGENTLEKIAFSIYRAYAIGVSLYDNENDKQETNFQVN